MRIVFIILLVLHGIIHVLGFLKAFSIYQFKELTLPISKTMGILWLFATLVILTTALLYAVKLNTWWVFGLVSFVLSQFLVIYFWQDAKYATILNVLLLLICMIGFGKWSVQSNYREDVKSLLTQNKIEADTIKAADLNHLPTPVQKYLNYVGVIGQPKIKNFKAIYDVEMRSKDQDWFSFRSEQYNFFQEPARLYFLDAKFKGLTTVGYHRYMDQEAEMNIKLLGWFSVAHEKGEALFKAETVTFFNDLCIMAPGALISPNIQWKEINDTIAEAEFTNQDVTIQAQLIFNDQGQLVDFISNDRLDVNAGKTFPFSTPMGNYESINGFNLPHYGEAIWHYPEGEFTYGKFRLIDIQYNVSE